MFRSRICCFRMSNLPAPDFKDPKQVAAYNARVLAEMEVSETLGFVCIVSYSRRKRKSSGPIITPGLTFLHGLTRRWRLIHFI